MKYLYLLCFAALSFVSCKKNSSPSAPILDSPAYRFFQGTIGNSERSSILTSDGNVAIAGGANGHVLLLKLSPGGNQLLRKEIDARIDTHYAINDIYSLAQTNDDGYMLCGTAYTNYTASTDVCLVKLDSKGTFQWVRTYGGNKADYGNHIIRDRDGNYVVCGTSYSFTTEGYNDIYMLKVNDGGDVIWAKNYNKHEQQTPFHLLETRDGGYLVTGTDEPTGGSRILYMLKVDANGNMLWDNSASTNQGGWGYCSAECDNGDLMICGGVNSKVLLMRTSSTGTQIWKNTYATDSVAYYGMSIKPRDGSFFITGNCNTYYAYNHNCFLLKVNDAGTQQWLKRLQDDRTIYASSILITGGGDNILTGNQYVGPNENNIFFTKMDANGNYR